MAEMRRLKAVFDETNYDIVFGKGVIDNIVKYVNEVTNNKKVILVADIFFQESIGLKIEKLFKDSEYEIHTFYMSAGKGNKNINEVLKIYGILEEYNFARDSVLIALGGGVIGDLAGFIASTWLRGMKLIHIPTTLMAMVDSSIGGKVAINFRQTINAIGNYYHPVYNIMDLNFVDSLPDRDYYAGIAEVIKCGIINDKNFYHFLENKNTEISSRENDYVIDFIIKTIEIKIDHVNGDLREGGKRLLLNYGHTLGHAIEISTEKNHHEQLRHGEGVSVGIIAAAHIATAHLGINKSIMHSYERLFKIYNLPISISASELGFKKEHLLKKCFENVQKDKKRKDNNIRVILANEIGKSKVYNDVPFTIIKSAFEYVIKD